jgi:hypothetical protein
MDTESVMKQLQAMEAKIEKLTGNNYPLRPLLRLTLYVTAEADVRKLQHIYGYYLDKCLYKEVYTGPNKCDPNFHMTNTIRWWICSQTPQMHTYSS